MTLGRVQSRIGADLPADRAQNLLPNCLGRCSFCAPENPSSVGLSAAKGRTKDRQTALGIRHGAFPRRGFAAHRSNIREWYSPPAPNSWPSNIPALAQFRTRCGFLFGAYHIAGRCGPLATYRRISCPSASTICRCITVCSGGPHSSGIYTSHIAGRISWSRCRAMTIVSLEIKSKGNGQTRHQAKGKVK